MHSRPWFGGRRVGWTSAVALLVGTLITTLPVARSLHAAAQSPKSVLDAVYTEEQAKHGKAIYGQSCALCHGDPPIGTTMAPSLSGDDFLATYNGATAGDLFSKISKTMPADDPGTLKPRDTVELLAYLFGVNKWPPGGAELPTDLATLKQIRIQTKSSR
jgi:mono/diheme cytochrome c family protein